MKFFYSLSIIFIIPSLLSCQKKEILTSSNNKKLLRKIFIKSNTDPTKTESLKINLDRNIATLENIETQIKSGNAKFISFGIASQDFRKFKEKYGVDLKTEGCVIDTSSAKKAKQNNTFLAKYLTQKYGETWTKDLPFKLFGLDEI